MLDVVLRHRFITLMSFFATVALSVLSFYHHSEGIFPEPGYRLDHRHDGGRAELFPSPKWRASRSGSATWFFAIRRSTRLACPLAPAAAQPGHNTGRLLHHAQAEQRARRGDEQINRRIRRAATQDRGSHYLPAKRTGCRGRRANQPHAIPIYVDRCRPGRISEWSAEISVQVQNSGSPRCRKRSASGGTDSEGRRGRRTASRFSIMPQMSTTRSTTPSASGRSRNFHPIQHYHVISKVGPEFQKLAGDCKRLYRQIQLKGHMVPLKAFVPLGKRKGEPMTISAPRPIPGDDLSFNLSPGRSLGEATVAIDKVMRTRNVAGLPHGSVPGQCGGVPGFFEKRVISSPRHSSLST